MSEVVEFVSFYVYVFRNLPVRSLVAMAALALFVVGLLVDRARGWRWLDALHDRLQ